MDFLPEACASPKSGQGHGREVVPFQPVCQEVGVFKRMEKDVPLTSSAVMFGTKSVWRHGGWARPSLALAFYWTLLGKLDLKALSSGHLTVLPFSTCCQCLKVRR